MFQLLKEVITSWQVIAITVALVLYLHIVFYVARAYRRPKAAKTIFKKKKAKPDAAAGGGPEVSSEDDADSNNDLGLEES